jgi:hypothetical protein
MAMKRLFVVLCFCGLCTAAFCGGGSDGSGSPPASAAGTDSGGSLSPVTIDSSLPLEEQLQQARQRRRELQQRLEQEQSRRARLENELEGARRERQKLEQELAYLIRQEAELLEALERQYFQTILPGIYSELSPGYRGFGIGVALGMYEPGEIVPYLHGLFGVNSINYFAVDAIYIKNSNTGIYTKDGGFNRFLAKEHYLVRFGESDFSLALHNSNVFVFNQGDDVTTRGVVSGELKFYGHIGSSMDVLVSAGVPYIYSTPEEDPSMSNRLGFAGLFKPSFYMMNNLFALSGLLAYNTLEYASYTMNEVDRKGLLYGGSLNFRLHKGWVFAFEHLGRAEDNRSEFALSVSGSIGVLFLWGRLPYGNIRAAGEKALNPSFGAEVRF